MFSNKSTLWDKIVTSHRMLTRTAGLDGKTCQYTQWVKMVTVTSHRMFNKHRWTGFFFVLFVKPAHTGVRWLQSIQGHKILIHTVEQNGNKSQCRQ